MKKLSLSLSFVVVLIFASSWGHAAAVEKPKQGGTLRIGIRKDITNMSPFVEYLSTNAQVKSLIYESLVGVTNALDVVPSLAESWSISKDGKEYLFHLRKGVVFHNGKELDAEDVKWSLEYILEPKNRASAHGLISIINEIDLVDKYRVKLTLNEPFAPLLAVGLTQDTVIVPRNSVPLGGGDASAAAPSGTGPFQLAEWKRAIEIRLAANKRYWSKGIPYLDELILKPVPSADVRFISLRSGDLDLIEEVPYPLVNEVRKGKYPDLRLVPARIGGFRTIKMNVEAPFFKDPRIRKAVAHAVDRKAYIEGAVFGHGEPAYQVYPKGWKWYFDDVKSLEMDLEKARALLAEAGYPNGFKSFLEARQGEEPDNMMLQSQLKRVGIDLEIKIMDFASLRKSEYDGTGNIQISGSGVFADIDRALHRNFHSEPGPKRNTNHTGYNNSEVDRLLDKARTLSDTSARRELYKKATDIITNESPQVNLAFLTRFYGSRSYVNGFSTNFGGPPRLFFPDGGLSVTWVEKAGK